MRKQPQEEQSNDEKEAMQQLRYSLDITLASQAEDPPEYVRRAFSCWPPREGNIEDAFAAQDHEVEEEEGEEEEEEEEDDDDEQLEDDEGVAAAEQEMDSELMENVGHGVQESEKELEGKQDEGALKSIAIRPKESQDAEGKAGKPVGEEAPGAEVKSTAKSSAKPSAKSLVFARKRSTKVVKQPARRRF